MTDNGTPSGFFLLLGSSELLALRARRDELLQAGQAAGDQVQRLNLTEDDPREIMIAASAPSLFGGMRVVSCDNFDLFPKELAAELKRSLRGSDALIVAVASKTPSKEVVEAAGAKVEKFTEPKGAAISSQIEALAAKWGVQLDRSGVARIAKGGVADWNALDNALSKLADLGVSTASAADITALEAVVTGAPPPWDLSDAIETGNAAKALAILGAGESSPFQTFAYLANRIRDLSMVKESGARTPEEVQKLCGMKHPFPAKKLLELSRRVAADRLPTLWEVVVSTDLRMRRESDAGRVMEEAVVALARAMR